MTNAIVYSYTGLTVSKWISFSVGTFLITHQKAMQYNVALF